MKLMERLLQMARESNQAPGPGGGVPQAVRMPINIQAEWPHVLLITAWAMSRFAVLPAVVRVS
jgi:hypothetical protein